MNISVFKNSILAIMSAALIAASNPPDAEEPFDITLAFAGDINFDDTQGTMATLKNHGGDLSSVIDSEYLRLMNDADIMWINNEFTYSLRGAPLNGKMYTFRANPDNVNYLHEMGVDIVGLANNHVYDYGKDALIDTLSTLQDAGIPYVGAGMNLSEASAPVYLKAGDITVAYVAASRAEKFQMTPQATETEPGILRCYDNELFLESIREARKNADFVIALPHWGTEYSTVLEAAQITGAKEYIDAGADAVVGAHTHCVQGFEYYDGKPIVYSMGNYWFNGKPLETMLVELHISGKAYKNPFKASDSLSCEIDDVKLRIVPGTQISFITKPAATHEDCRRILDYLESISVNVTIDDDGIVH
ncbi:MAG: CapA family protein [Lachnospiraceae bacterium]|nr:CapA family protein [Lachnospiraceae bacterium]